MKFKGFLASCFFTMIYVGQHAYAGSTIVQILESPESQPKLLKIGQVKQPAPFDHASLESRYPQTIIEHGDPSEAMISEWIIPESINLEEWLNTAKVDTSSYAETLDMVDEVLTIVDNGPSENRIDLVFMGDGYTTGEREKFFDDVKRLTQDMFVGQTFSSYLPLFNVHAVFRPSEETGIGRNSRPKNTAYKLYREGNTLRAIFPGNKSALRQSCAQAPDCDYPIVIANDPHYGGLGGEFAISTSSPTSGTVVLRHELGHNFGRVGEEYDGGGYFGANYSYSPSYVGWKHWLSEGSERAQKARARFIDWPWKNLNEGAFTARWRSDGTDAHYEITYSASGVDNDDSLIIELDGERLPFTSPGTLDRSFQTIMSHSGGFTDGSHELTFRKGLTHGEPWFSNIAVFEYGPSYNFNPHHVSAYPLFDKNNYVAGYRPTDKTCLMRDMTSVEFCNVCQENNWLKFFSKISMIDDLQVSKLSNMTSVRLNVPPLGQFRTENFQEQESVRITWLHNGKEVKELADLNSWERPSEDTHGDWRVQVELVSPEVRRDPRGLLKASRNFSL